ncbi:hypothetical protein [Bacillus sp. OxB-1]|uniref:hypothetical protein n=1 Tax=Bacillus sp. (strain OxB-1) TaxID=98228 RepID=UPI00059732AB|nr:hypothetical protein [Bacillus sp. OxB-1]
MEKEDLIKFAEEALDNLHQLNLKEEKQLQKYRLMFENDPSLEELFGGLKEDEKIANELKETEESFRALIEKIKNS